MKTYAEAYDTVISARTVSIPSDRLLTKAVEDFSRQYGTMDDIVSHERSLGMINVQARTFLHLVFGPRDAQSIPEEVETHILECLVSALATQLAVGVAIGIEMEKQEVNAG